MIHDNNVIYSGELKLRLACLEERLAILTDEVDETHSSLVAAKEELNRARMANAHEDIFQDLIDQVQVLNGDYALVKKNFDNFVNDYEDEINELREMSECNIEWEVGEVAFVHCDYFADYCEEIIWETYPEIKNLPPFVLDEINWERVADSMEVDYSEITYRGETYLYLKV